MLSKEDTPGAKAAKPPGLWKLVGIPFLFFHVLVLVSESLRWSIPGCGISNGLFVSFFTGFLWLVTVLPWGVFFSWLYRWRGWRRFRTAWIAAPGLILCGHLVFKTLQSPPTAATVFLERTGVPLPQVIRNLQWFTEGGGFGGFSGSYAFETADKTVTDKLIRDLKLSESDKEATWTGPGRGGISPGFSEGEKLRSYGGEYGFTRIDLLTDEVGRKVHILIFR